MTCVEELTEALASRDALLSWLAGRGWRIDPEAARVRSVARLPGAANLCSPEVPAAPRLLLVWLDQEGATGKRLREIQRHVADYHRELGVEGMVDAQPVLGLCATRSFISVFPVGDDQEFARRQRFSEGSLQREDGGIAGLFRDFRADVLQGWSEEERLPIIDEVVRRWRFDQHLYRGESLDDRFVAVMSAARQTIVSRLLGHGDEPTLLHPVLEQLGIAGEDGAPPDRETLVSRRVWRNQLVAVADTVLLRLVLYRYLEAQFGYEMGDDERSEIGYGYDTLLERTTRSNQKRIERLMEQAGAAARGKQASQLDLFGQATEVTRPEEFDQELQRRSEFYQQSAGGDLHQGRIAGAADVLQGWLTEHHRDTIATLLEVSRSDRYSFDYADLDPRAFQKFYEQTIGTDIRTVYDRETGRMEVRVVDWQKNRKEQGAYFTPEPLCEWLVKRTLGRRLDAWIQELRGALDAGEKAPAIARRLDTMMRWTVIDPTCGGGIFLRAAFEALSALHGKVQELLRVRLSAADARVVFSGPRRVFGPDAQVGDWEWHVLLHVLHGVDVDAKALNVASNLLTLSALKYKRHSVAFPSFMNVNLKRGNAFVLPLRGERRQEFQRAYQEKLAELMRLRADLRRTGLDRDRWREAHDRAEQLTRDLVDPEIARTFGPCFPNLPSEAVVRRVRDHVGVMLYEAEFPEVYFEPNGTWRENPGFDVVLGNPPWEEPAAEYKKFLPEFDPGYLALTGKASREREKSLLKDPVIAARWEEFSESVEDYKSLLKASGYEHQRRRVKGRYPGAHSNLYKYATELGWRLLRDGGYFGMVLDGGLLNDLSASGVRALLLEEMRLHDVCSFINNRGLFEDVHRSYRFACVVAENTAHLATSFSGRFLALAFSELDSFERMAVTLDASWIRNHPRDSYPIPEVRDEQHLLTIQALESHPPLGDEPWTVDVYSRELNAGEQRHFFWRERPAEAVPLLSGAQFNLWGVHFGTPPEFHVSLADAEAGGFLRAKQVRRLERFAAAHGAHLDPESLRLDMDEYRIAWRDIARNDDKRTLIAAVVPPQVALVHTAPFIRGLVPTVKEGEVRFERQYPLPAMLYLVGVLSSFACDGIVRGRMSKTHLTGTLLKATEVPPWEDAPDQREIATLAARLTCLPATEERPWADYTELAAAVGLTPERDGLTDPGERFEAEVALNALVARRYGLDAERFAYLMNTLFMTKAHAAEHTRYRDAIVARLPRAEVGPELPN